MFDDVVVRLIKLPASVHGFTSESNDGYYNIYLNQNLTYEQRREVLEHELRHIYRMDFDTHLPLEAVENF